MVLVYFVLLFVRQNNLYCVRLEVFLSTHALCRMSPISLFLLGHQLQYRQLNRFEFGKAELCFYPTSFLSTLQGFL